VTTSRIHDNPVDCLSVYKSEESGRHRIVTAGKHTPPQAQLRECRSLGGKGLCHIGKHPAEALSCYWVGMTGRDQAIKVWDPLTGETVGAACRQLCYDIKPINGFHTQGCALLGDRNLQKPHHTYPWCGLRALPGLGWQIRTLATDQSALAVISYQLASGQWRAVAPTSWHVMVFDPEAGRLEAEVGLPRDFRYRGMPSLFESEDGRWCLAMLGKEGVLCIWDVGHAPPSTGALRSALKTG
jgi:hypothetical protein